ncbi:MAG: UDP-N-acetylmuramoyl-tripeptide--D-alanyl-D-alanine ligase [Candidatus Pacebacteria bacterium]|nr:UDP-N-acetylmuramoyl-tripeptide--D-alanyl-D-alanine ligase [Candidatus Paceibacterota bacterium]
MWTIKALRSILRRLARLTIWRYRPGIIGITGSAGKTSAKLAVKAVLEKGRTVRVSPGNTNNDLGVPLTILGDWKQEDLALITHGTPRGALRMKKATFWIKVIAVSLWHVIVRIPDYPEILILEYGADHPGDIKYLLTIARPNISIITAIGDIPVHVENYAGPEEVAREKGRLLEFLSVGGFAILNGDDAVVRNLQSRTRARVITYGFEKGNEVRMVRFENKIKHGAPDGISFKLEYGSGVVPVRIPHVFGRTHAYAAAAAASVGIVFGMNLIAISDALAAYAPAASRMQLVRGIRSSYVIDDSYNASPIAMRFALETLYNLPAKRRIAVLGDMLEIGKYTEEAHTRVGNFVAKTADVLFAVGPRARTIADAARAAGMKKADIFIFDSAEIAKLRVRDFIKPDDLVLVKGSHSMRLDKIVDEIVDRTL